MSRSEKRRRREERERRRQNPGSFREFKRRQSDRLEEAHALFLAGRLNEARHILEEHSRAHPSQAKPLRLLMDVLHGQRDYAAYCQTCERLLELEPHDHELHLPLAGAYELTLRPASALVEYRRFLEHCPGHPLAGEARESMAQLEAALEKFLSESPFPPESRLELTVLHEQVLAGTSGRQFEQTIAVAETLRARCPTFIPVLNNLAQLYFLVGRVQDAIDLAHEVVEREPENCFAVASLARYFLLAGRPQEATAWHDRLLALRSDQPDGWFKKAETFTFFGNDAAVLEAFDGARRAGLLDEGYPSDPRFYCFAGVAAARQGDEARARRYFRTAVERMPDDSTARENLAELDKPVSDRSSPWALGMEYWVRPALVDRLKKISARFSADREGFSEKEAVRQITDEFPELIALVPHLLDRGDRLSRALALRIAFALETPELIEALRSFCLSQRGPDSVRMETANRLYAKERLESPLRFWVRGRWEEVELRSFEIVEGPMRDPAYGREAKQWAQAAFEALHRGDGRTAEKLLKKCLEQVGEEPELLNNLAMAYHVQGRDDEFERLARVVHERWPAYFFGRIHMAQFAIAAGEFERAAEYLKPLEKRRRLHASEFSALCSTQIRLHTASGKHKSARTWLDIWKEIQPDHAAIPDYEREVASASFAGPFTNWPKFPWRRQKKHRN